MKTPPRMPPSKTNPKNASIPVRKKVPAIKPISEIDENAIAELGMYDNSKKLNLGWIGKCVGCPDQAPYNIGFIVIVGSFIIFAWGCTNGSISPEKIIPVVTLVLGYLFGHSKKAT